MYREMKDSGIEWIGYVPNEWYLEKLKNLYSFEKGKNAALYTQEYIGTHKGEYPVYSGQTENDGIMGNIDTYDYEENECLFTTTVGAKVMTPRVIKGKFSLSQNCLIMKSNNNSSIKFIYYMLNPLFNYEKSLIPAYMQPSLRVSDLRRYQFYVPNVEEQQQIVNYLDKKVSQIDDIISKQKSLIEKYKAYKQSLITETVTKGLNKNVPMKDSGIEWIGEIPSDWSVTITKNISNKITDGAHVSPETENGVYDFISVVNLDNNFINFNGCLKTSEASYIQMVKNGCKPKKGDVLISKDGTVGKSVVIDYDREFVIASSLVILTPNEKMNSYFLNYVIQSSCIQEQLNSFMKGSGLKRVSVKNNGKLYVTVPSISEQEDIVNFLDKKCSAIDSAIAKKEQLIEKLESYKKSLIYECVTGKREVN